MDLVSSNFSDLLKPNIETKKFPDGEKYIKIPEKVEEKVNLFHRLYPNQDEALIEVFLILSTLKQKEVEVTLIAPYVPYARQDKIFLEGEALSSEIICGLLSHSGVKNIVTLDCHFLKKEGEFQYNGLTIKNISMANPLIEHAKKKYDAPELEVISPDVGASYMTEAHGGKSMKKVRGEYNEGDEAYRKIEKVESSYDFTGADVLVLDDMISTGGTMVRAVENVKKGGAKRVFCAATHGFFLKNSLEKLRDVSDGVFVTNSIPSEVSEVNFMDEIKLK